ncbi:hypothetical protein C5167_023902 [Papaver somniferum]|uniref:Uncharacterized protein n=1 Tax=Papaver somniferum TaxID=3469 RepID=A0A4Y7JN45_PAPSO|nr:hypothetical protein C5167_023902 [Papaver somniferum]
MGNVDEMSFSEEYLEENVASTNVEEEPENISAIKASVKVLLEGLGEDSNREGLIKTPLRVAKALLDGTRES